ncbi:MAG: hypothetical protein JXA53_08945 [Bacteroidales bacterium]|nr:hypothetical protein [Bacteroidales bacterium]
MYKLKIVLFGLAVLFFTACQQTNSDEAIAKLGEKTLYKKDIANLVPKNTTKEDSIIITKKYINKWLINQLLTATAEKNLSAEEQDITKELEETKSSLLIYKYRQKYINQKIDTVVKADEIKEYYDQNTASFSLSEDIIKCVFIQIKNNITETDRIKKLYRSEKEDDIKELDEICLQYATKYDFFNEDWISLRTVNSNLPTKASVTSKNSFIEQADSTFLYFVDIKDFMKKGELSPLNFVQDDIRSIIIEKRKLQLLKNLENNIYKDAVKHNKFTIFEPEKK